MVALETAKLLSASIQKSLTAMFVFAMKDSLVIILLAAVTSMTHRR